MASSLSVNTSGIGVGNQMVLADLREGSTGPITVMVCRKWDVTSVNGRYMSTDYVVSDIKVTLTLLTPAPFPFYEFHRY